MSQVKIIVNNGECGADPVVTLLERLVAIGEMQQRTLNRIDRRLASLTIEPPIGFAGPPEFLGITTGENGMKVRKYRIALPVVPAEEDAEIIGHRFTARDVTRDVVVTPPTDVMRTVDDEGNKVSGYGEFAVPENSSVELSVATLDNALGEDGNPQPNDSDYYVAPPFFARDAEDASVPTGFPSAPEFLGEEEVPE